MNSSVKKFLKYALNIIFIIGITALALYLIFKGKDPREILRMVWEADLKWIGIAVFFMILLVCGEAAQFHMLLKGMKQKVSRFKCFLISNIGFFFSQITPGASGGQPLQVVYLTKLGVNGFISTLICMIITMVYKLVLILMFFVALIMRPALVGGAIGDVIIVFLIGMLITAGFGFFLLFCILKPSMSPKMAGGFLKLGAKLHLVKDLEASRKKMEQSAKQHEVASEFIKKNPGIVLKVAGFAFIERFSCFMVAFCVAKSLGVECNLIDVISMQIILSLAVDMLPIPGASGANEILFKRLQVGIFGDAVEAGILLNRGITYYLLALTSGVFTLIAHIWFKKPSVRNANPLSAEESEQTELSENTDGKE